MNKIALVAVIAALGFNTSAMAADLGVINVAQPAAFDAPAAYDWTGFYAGLNAGYGWAAVQVGGLTFNDGKGILGGAQVGFNYDFSGFVLGAEADFQLSDINYEQTVALGVTGRTAIDNFGTLRARAGVSVDRFLPYITGGLAWANASISASGGGASVNVKDSYVGWTIGAGLEYAVTDNISVKGEYLYTDFGAADFGTGINLNLTSHVARVGVNYQF